MRLLTAILALLLLAPPALRAQPPQAAIAGAQDDGPYVLWDGSIAKVLHQRQGRLEETPLKPPYRLELEGLPTLALSPAPVPPAQAVFPLPPTLAAIGDAHGNYPAFVNLLTVHGIIDARHRWTFGKGHLVITGDIFDRGAQVTELLWLVRSLECQARAAGGRVHMLLGNHEVMVMGNDLRYLNPRYLLLPYTIPFLYGPSSDMGRWLRSLPVMVRLGDVLFVHGGISPAFAEAHPDLAAVNAAARGELASSPGAVLGNGGLLWYRGLIPGASRDPLPSVAEVDTLLRTYHARTLVVGHTIQDQITPLHEARVYAIDAGMGEGREGELWLQVRGKRYRGLPDGTRVSLP